MEIKIVVEQLMSRPSNKSRSRRRGRRDAAAGLTALFASRGAVMIAICTGAVMWGYALFNIATRA
jgi:hypothetical protein